jgi:hypothetical protein
MQAWSSSPLLANTSAGMESERGRGMYKTNNFRIAVITEIIDHKRYVSC